MVALKQEYQQVAVPKGQSYLGVLESENLETGRHGIQNRAGIAQSRGDFASSDYVHDLQ